MAVLMKKVAVMKQAMKAASVKTAMKKVPAMKAAAMKKTMKKKSVSIVATGSRAKYSVFTGRKEKTSGGLTKAALSKNKSGKVVSKKLSARAKKSYASGPLKAWADACKAARKALGLTGFVPIGGKSVAGKALLAKVRSML